jgi:tetratricopeptide (TPR) repeat protein
LSEQGDYQAVASVHSERAAYALNRGDLEQALTLYLEADQIRRRAGATVSLNLLMLGVVYRKKKDYLQARGYLQQLLEQGERHHDRSDIATASHHLAWVFFDQGQLDEARSFCGRAIALYKDFADWRGFADAYDQLGRIELAEGHAPEALVHLQQALHLRQELHNQQGTASSLSHLAIAHVSMGHLYAALQCLCQSLMLYRRISMLSRRRLVTILRQFLHHLWKPPERIR